ncbi:hypothetical protein ACWCW7_34590 [Nocardia tengchongensis]
MKSFAVLAFAAVAVLAAGCSSGQSGSKEDLSDTALAREFSQKVYAKSLDDSAVGPDAATKAMVDTAQQTCATLRTLKDSGQVSTDSSYSGNSTALAAVEVQMAKSAAYTSQQTQDALLVSAKYKCSEFSSMLRAYDAAH